MFIRVFPYAYGRVCVDESTSAAGMQTPCVTCLLGFSCRKGSGVKCQDAVCLCIGKVIKRCTRVALHEQHGRHDQDRLGAQPGRSWACRSSDVPKAFFMN